MKFVEKHPWMTFFLAAGAINAVVAIAKRDPPAVSGYGLDYNANLTLENAGLPQPTAKITWGEPVITSRDGQGAAPKVNATTVAGIGLLAAAAWMALG